MTRLTLTYGVLPPETELLTRLPDGFHVRAGLSGLFLATDCAMVMGQQAVYSREDMVRLLKALVTAWENGDDESGREASDILGIIGVEWV